MLNRRGSQKFQKKKSTDPFPMPIPPPRSRIPNSNTLGEAITLHQTLRKTKDLKVAAYI